MRTQVHRPRGDAPEVESLPLRLPGRNPDLRRFGVFQIAVRYQFPTSAAPEQSI
jgi:hypothetical protein